MTGKYIYGIIDSLNLPGGESLFLSKRTIFCKDVQVVSYQDISAVVADAEIVDCMCLSKDLLARKLLCHQSLIEEIMTEYAIIPMKLGTYACNEAEVREILVKGYNVVRRTFEKIKNRIEVDIAVTWSDFDAVLKDVGEEREVNELKEKILAGSADISVDDRIKMGFMVKKVLDKKREKCAVRIEDVFKSLSWEFKSHDLMDDKMVANFSFLIEKNMCEDFDEKIEELNAEFCDKLNFRRVGPLPVYSFYTLEVKKMNFQEINEARKKLGLDDISTSGEIKRARLIRAASFHPDKNPHLPGVERDFDEVIKAYKILADYCQACEQVVGDGKIFFKEDEFKNNAILVRVKA